jgi:predicted TIM-barrel fold metal-dependent hydrolase
MRWLADIRGIGSRHALCGAQPGLMVRGSPAQEVQFQVPIQPRARVETVQNRSWVKVTCPERMTLAGPPYDDVVPFGRALVEHFPDRVIWGTDWPHPNMKKEAPDDGMIVDHIPKIALTAAEQKALLVDNSMRLYWN